MHANVFTRAVGYRGVVNLQGEVVIAAQLDPREEAALHAAVDWAERHLTDILVRDEDGRISLVPPREGLVPAILPAVPRKPVQVPVKAPSKASVKTSGRPEEREKTRTSELSREASKRAQGARFRTARDRRRRPRRFGNQGS